VTIPQVRCWSTMTYGSIADSPMPVGTGGSAKTGPSFPSIEDRAKLTGASRIVSDELELLTDLPKGAEGLIQVVAGVHR
jgi:hypothetical protein